MAELNDAKGAPRRRDVILGVGAGLGAAACGGGADGAPAVHTGGKRLRWQLASSFPSSLDAMFGSAQVLCEEVEAMSGGRFKITPYQAGELVPGTEVFDAVAKGAVPMGQTASYYYTGKAPVLAFETCVPFGLTARQQSAWLDEGGGAELFAPIFADFDLVALAAGNTGAQMGGWFRRRVDSLADLAGLKMRIPGLGGKVMDQLGVSVRTLAGGEIYQALERGNIDATEWVGPYDDMKLGFHEVCANYYYPGWWEPGPHLAFYVNKAQWEELGSEYQAMLRTASRRAAMVMQTRYDALNPAALVELRKTGIDVRPFSQELMRGARDASEQLLSDEASGDGTYAKVLESWRSFRDASNSWFATAEYEYQRFTFGS
ncbi:MAG: TRAP transporter substrate-binding protein DctP [Planctomycetota bacterium]|nr:TRAP transporter substrate-binding protein DctP [Planctomycetota bacterium]